MTDLPFHSLADLFPLIEGKEFDDLVTSIRDNGLREAIIIFEGAILDGRNRYRACKVAGVPPMTEEFPGGDPIRFVIDKNIHRRHLTTSQRAIIAAEFATLKLGHVNAQRLVNTQENDGDRNRPPPLSAKQAADMLHVGKTTVTEAKLVLSQGTAQEIDAIKRGKISVETVAKDIRAKRSPAERKRRRDESLSGKGKNPERIQTMRINAQIWSDLRVALEKLSGMPLASDVVAIVLAYNKAKPAIVDDHLPQALEWIKDFAHGWSNRDQVANKEKQDRDGDPHAGNGNGTSRPQSTQSAAA